ncbi:c-type cytochrome [Pelagibius sp. CAU 1746]|uniref:c-type cytochrome n=1 Tax=Pelagibius sp. CAU 1746 TaxID=3140370 RepID=UPI00325BAD75
MRSYRGTTAPCRLGRRGWAVACAVLGLAAIVISAAEARAETLLERGTYLMQSIVACGNCHTPQGPEGPLAGMELAGGLRIDDDAFTAYGANLTPDVETGLGGWTDEQIIAAIREGRRPDGSIIGPPMPISLYRSLSDRDVRAIVAYLRSLKAVKNQVPASEYRIPLPPSYGPPVTAVAEVTPADGAAYGAYLAGPLGHCIECHSPMGPKGPDWEHQTGAGGLAFRGPWGTSYGANITPANLGGWSDAEIKMAITQGLRPDGSRLLPPMPVGYYANIAEADLDAIVAYLRSLPER